jgi:L-lysine exporter family protein LysE/ArgO
MLYFFQGFLLGLAYVAPIGMQNMYVINSAIKFARVKAYQVALITALFDITLALACFFGVGIILERFPSLRYIVLAAGSIAIIYIGSGLIRSKPVIDQGPASVRFTKVLWMCFAVTWLNPQAIIDGSLLLGGYRAILTSSGSGFFIVGVGAASLGWFLALTTIMSIFKTTMNEKTLSYINIACGLIIIFYGLRLGYLLLSLLI